VRYGKVPGVEKPVSRLVQGTVMVSTENLEASFALLDAVFELGCNTFDTAHVYGNGDKDRTLGMWVNDRGIRDKVVIVGKGAHHNDARRRVTPFDIASDLHDSLARMQVDFIDLYLLHRDDPNVPVGPIVEALNEHLRAGRIRAFGGSNWSAQRLREANAYARERGLAPFVVSSPNLSLAEQIEEPWENCISIAGPKGKADREWYRQEGMAVFAWSSLAGGFFSGRLHRGNLAEHAEALYYRSYVSEENLDRLERVEQLAKKKGLTVPQVAMAYVMNLPLNVFGLVGCETREEFAANVKALEVTLTPEEMAWLDLQDEKVLA
jgi:aryl-alcohol dehydrogenase-like predicted oxidoreductase